MLHPVPYRLTCLEHTRNGFFCGLNIIFEAKRKKRQTNCKTNFFLALHSHNVTRLGSIFETLADPYRLIPSKFKWVLSFFAVLLISPTSPLPLNSLRFKLQTLALVWNIRFRDLWTWYTWNIINNFECGTYCRVLASIWYKFHWYRLSGCETEPDIFDEGRKGNIKF